ncbi:AmmeMemoRadiSam system protein B [Candidatus Dependentiae bacterium]|nr:AmmeMemoRadiSam system protein B [Candidatus Dependentiae bacterium]
MVFSRELVRNGIYFAVAVLFLGTFGFVLYQKIFPKIVFVSRFPETWYPRDKKSLTSTLDLLFKGVFELTEANERRSAPWMIIVPHAAYLYSGMVAAAGYSLLKGSDAKKYKRVLLIAPSHYVDFYGLAIPDFTHYQSPLGESVVDVDAIELMKGASNVGVEEVIFHREHAIDVQIPFIQTVLPQAKIVPLVIGRLAGDDMLHHLAQVLLKFFDEHTLIVVSSDMLHYGKKFNCCPFGDSLDAQKKMYELENSLIESIQRLDVREFDSFVSRSGAAICGKNAIKLALELANLFWIQERDDLRLLSKASFAMLLAQQSSFVVRQQAGESLDALEHVGYSAIAAWRKK